MRRILTVLVYVIITAILLTVILIGCSRMSNEGPGDGRIKVAVSILPQVEFTEKVGGDKVDVTVMIPPGASPHTYELTPGQLEEVSKAEMYAKVGSGIEFELEWMDKIIELNKKMLVVDCARGVKFIASDHKYDEPFIYYEYNEINGIKDSFRGVDPHIWLSPANAKIMSENIYEGLVKIEPQNREYYRKNLDSFIAELDKLDKEISRMFEGKKNKIIMVYHPNWTYFASDYGIEQIPIEEEGKEPTAEVMKNLIDQAVKYNIKVIFASPQFSTRSAETLAREIGGSVILVSPLEKNYIENMRKTAEAFAESME